MQEYGTMRVCVTSPYREGPVLSLSRLEKKEAKKEKFWRHVLRGRAGKPTRGAGCTGLRLGSSSSEYRRGPSAKFPAGRRVSSILDVPLEPPDTAARFASRRAFKRFSAFVAPGFSPYPLAGLE